VGAVVCREVVARAEDRVVWAADIASEPVSAPGRRLELHRPLGALNHRVSHLVEGRLDEADRREQLPADAEAPLRFVVPGQETLRRRRVPDANATGTRGGFCEPAELPQCDGVVTYGWVARGNSSLEHPVGGEQADRVLLVERERATDRTRFRSRCDGT
jgi:hypothetical protein